MAVDRFFRRGLSVVVFAPAVADKAAPSRVEIDGGVNLVEAVAGINGFQFTNSPVPTPHLGATFTPQIEGEDTAQDSSLDLYDDKTDDTTRLALAKGTAGFLLFMPYGDTAALRMETWPVKSTGTNDEWTLGNDPARLQVPFAIVDVPEQDAVIPAAA